MKLYNVSYSGNSYKIRLLLAQLGTPCMIVEVDILKGESRTAQFLKINPNGRTPVLEDNGFVLAESNVILASSRAERGFCRKSGTSGRWYFNGCSLSSIAMNPTSPPRAS